jgi:hypothetical protein
LPVAEAHYLGRLVVESSSEQPRYPSCPQVTCDTSMEGRQEHRRVSIIFIFDVPDRAPMK